MEKFGIFCTLGLKYLYRYRRRYYFLLAALIFGFAVVTFVTSIKDGMYDNVYYSAQSHYAGDIVTISYEYTDNGSFIHRMGRDEIAAVFRAVELSKINPQYTVMRTLFGFNSFLHHNGNAVQLRYLTGSDWESEEHIFSRMSFDEPPHPYFGDDGIILSVPVAQQLGVRMGDRVILELDTRYGQKNTGLFIVRGIVQDTSIFGFFKAYISRLTLNRLLLYEDDDCSSIGFFFDDPAVAEQKRIHLQEALWGNVQLGPLVHNREEMVRERDRPWEGMRIFLYTLPVYLSEVAYLLDAMNIITYFIYGMILLTILVSASVTYRLILRERSKEMGVMRTIGFLGKDLHLVLWTETLVLGIISIIAGFAVAYAAGWVISLVSFSWFPGFEIFLKDGRLIAMYLPETMVINIVFLLSVLVLLTLVPSFRVSRINLPGLLSGDPL